MTSTVTCRNCQQSFAAADHLCGKTVPCPKCQTPLTIPQAGAPTFAPHQPVPSAIAKPATIPSYTSPAASRTRSRSSQRGNVLLFAVLGGGAVILLGCGGVLAIVALRSLTGTPQPQVEYSNLLEGREGFRTTLTRRERAGYPVPVPPAPLFRLEQYHSPAGNLAAYVSPDPGDGQQHPAIIWVFGGFDNSIGETAWEPASPDNDQSARAFREAGIVMMYPSFRGGNQNPGHLEAFYGEVDDLLAAAEYLAGKEYVDPQRIYLGGHSTGGTLVMLAAAATDRFRAVFAFGPVDEVAGYGRDVLPFDLREDRELAVRNPIQWLHAMHSPVFVFEGTDGNLSCLRAMRRASQNPQLHFHEVPRADHFSILAPLTRRIADKIVRDTGPTCSIQFTPEEIH